ncbi:luciferase family oxidoreductase [Striga asiatica]|uniref:Luciferase family oxidoreductase n=1 Tax=Striga asiatica TaxID=4170 RepID=A0A5A7PT80_STRAF|nr:luciferase family oxidoreductase [Striga asiatica]
MIGKIIHPQIRDSTGIDIAAAYGRSTAEVLRLFSILLRRHQPVYLLDPRRRLHLEVRRGHTWSPGSRQRSRQRLRLHLEVGGPSRYGDQQERRCLLRRTDRDEPEWPPVEPVTALYVVGQILHAAAIDWIIYSGRHFRQCRHRAAAISHTERRVQSPVNPFVVAGDELEPHSLIFLKSAHIFVGERPPPPPGDEGHDADGTLWQTRSRGGGWDYRNLSCVSVFGPPYTCFISSKFPFLDKIMKIHILPNRFDYLELSAAVNLTLRTLVPSYYLKIEKFLDKLAANVVRVTEPNW